MAVNPYAYSQAQGAARMPQVGFGQSSPSPQYGGTPNQNAFTNANPRANLAQRFSGSSVGGGLPLPGSSPSTPPMINMDDYLAGTRQMTPQPYAGTPPMINMDDYLAGTRQMTPQPYMGTPPYISMDDYLAGTRQMTPQPVTGGGYPLPGGQPVTGGGYPLPGGQPVTGGGYPLPRNVSPFPYYSRFRQPNMQAFRNANPNANLGSRFGGGLYTTQPINNLAFPR